VHRERIRVPSQHAQALGGTNAKAHASTRTQQSTGFFACHYFVLDFQGSFLSTSTVLTSTTSSNIDNALLGMASTANNNTEDALDDSSSPGAQADDDHVQIVGSPRAIEERTFLKCKSNDDDDQQNKQKKQWKHPAISNKQQKCPAISDTDLEKQVNWVRDVSLQNVVDSSLQATQSPPKPGYLRQPSPRNYFVWYVGRCRRHPTE
jgi:hypothetical protein